MNERSDWAHYKRLPADERDALGFVEHQRRQAAHTGINGTSEAARQKGGA